MLGSIIGDIIGQTYEFDNAGRYDFDPFPPGSDFTDDTVLTVAVAAAIFMARKGADKAEIKEFLEKRFHYNLSRTLEEIKPDYTFNETCQKTVPEAFSCFLESSDFEDAIRKAIWLGGDSDTLACITGGIAEAYYREMKADWVEKAYELLPREFGEVIARFKATFAK